MIPKYRERGNNMDSKEHVFYIWTLAVYLKLRTVYLKEWMYYPTINSKLCLTAGTEQSSEPKIPVSA